MPPTDSGKRRTPRAAGRRPRRRHTRIDRFERLVAEVIDSLPPQFLPYLEKVAIIIEDWPDTTTPEEDAEQTAALSRGQLVEGL